MAVFFDTNLFVAVVTDDHDRSDEAVKLLNEVDEGYTSILNVMELRSVLAKKKAFDKRHIEAIEDKLVKRTTIIFPDASDIVVANKLQLQTWLYPMDALILAAAQSTDCPLVTFDNELLSHGAISPTQYLDS